VSQRNAHEEIEALEYLRAKALVDGDTDTLKMISAKDYMHIDADRVRRNLNDFLDSIDSNQVSFLSYTLPENEILTFNGMACTIGSFQNVRTCEVRGTITTYGRHIRIYLYRNDKWENVLHHGTRCSRQGHN